MSFEAPLAGTELFVPGFVVNGTNSYFRIANASGATANITARLYDSSGSQVGNTYSPSISTQRAGVYASSVFGASNGTYTLRIESDNNVTAAAWHETTGGHTGVTAQRASDSNGNYVYLPFLWENFNGWNEYAYLTFAGGSGNGASMGCYVSNGYCDTYPYLTVDQYDSYHDQWGGWNGELYIKNSSTSDYKPLETVKLEYSSTSNDWLMSYNGIVKTDNIWYVPFAPAPVVQFEWDAGGNTNEPDGVFGAAPYSSTGGHHDWYKEMNYMNWGAEKCSELVNSLTRSRFVPTWWGIGNTNLVSVTVGSGWEWKHDGSSNAYNSEIRLKAIRNGVPSECAGRPVKLINEPNNSGEDPDGDDELLGVQANMTYPEQFRALWLFRTWPGDVYGPFYANPNPNWTHESGCTNVSYGEGQARKTCFEKFVNNYIPNWNGVNGKTYSFGDFVDGIGLHFYAQPVEINPSDPDDTTGQNGSARGWANSWYSHMTTLSNTVPFNAEKTFFIAEYGITTDDDSSAAKQSIVDRLWAYDEIINRGMKADTPRMWYTNYCPQGAEYCPTFHRVDILYTGGSTTLTSPVGQGYFNEYKGKND